MSGSVVACDYTAAFIRAHLPCDAVSALEVGCGAGELAAQLANSGLEVTAIDSDEECVTATRRLGVDARLLQWPSPIEARFDAVLFTRSLHHITSLHEAISAAVAALNPGGRIIVEDFRIEAESSRCRAWFDGVIQLLDVGGLLPESLGSQSIVEKLSFGEHQHELHSSTAIVHALGGHGDVHAEDAAYYFRYAAVEIGDALATVLLNYELSMIEAGAIDALGRRFVLTPNS